LRSAAPTLIPLTLLLVNWLAIAGGVLALAAWLRRKGMSPWFAVVYGLFPGLYIALSRDLSEALAYGLVALGVYLFDFGPRYRLLLSAGVFALAGLTRETTVIFALGFAAAVLFQPGTAPDWRDRVRANWERALAFAGVAVAPLALYKVFPALAWSGQRPLYSVRPDSLAGSVALADVLGWTRGSGADSVGRGARAHRWRGGRPRPGAAGLGCTSMAAGGQCSSLRRLLASGCLCGDRRLVPREHRGRPQRSLMPAVYRPQSCPSRMVLGQFRPLALLDAILDPAPGGPLSAEVLNAALIAP
jgi:hypothetical protein